MSSPPGSSVRLFLVDGTAAGLITAEIIDWSGHVRAGSLGGLPAFLKCRSSIEPMSIYSRDGSRGS